MANFKITIDVTMSGDYCIEAENEQAAKEKVLQKCFVPSDLRWFGHLETKIVDIEEQG